MYLHNHLPILWESDAAQEFLYPQSKVHFMGGQFIYGGNLDV